MSLGRRRLSLRGRLLLVGVLGVASALAIGSLALYGALTVASYRTLDDSARAVATDVVGLAGTGRLPDPIPVTGSQIVQVVDSRARVVSASANADHLAALLTTRELRRALSGSPAQVPGSRVGLDSPLRVLAVSTGPADARLTVLVGQQIAAIQHSQHILAVLLSVTAPVLLLVLSLIAWRVIGATLRPVEALRASADRISGSDEGTRLPVSAAGDEISALAVTLNSMLDRLARSRERQRSFVADAAHELRSPLTSMQTQLEVAERLGEGTAVTDDLHAEVTRMTGLVEDLLVLARLDAEDRPARPAARVALDPLLTEVLDRHPAPRVPIRRGPPGGLAARGHADELRRAVSNVVDNALRHARGVVEVCAYADADDVVVEVCDDGSGISPADRDRVFERFTRLDEGRDRDAGGAGLGLAIVRELVHRSGGEIRLDESAGGGVRARLLLPRASG